MSSSTVFLHVGQCGNQIGKEFWSQISSDESDFWNDSFFYRSLDNKARCILVDTETKVINSAVNAIPLSSRRIRDENVLVAKDRGGRGGCWAAGYMGDGRDSTGECGRDAAVHVRALESVRREAERADCFSSIVMMHSAAGGTGGGLGSRLTELLRDEYPPCFLVNAVCLPSRKVCESPLQHFNTLLSCASLQRASDCIIYLDNDDLCARIHCRLQATDAPRGARLPYSMGTLNQLVTQYLLSLLSPHSGLFSSDVEETASRNITVDTIGELVRCVTPLRNCKFAHVAGVLRSKSKLAPDSVDFESMSAVHCDAVRLHHNALQDAIQPSQTLPLRSICNAVVVRGDFARVLPRERHAVQKHRDACDSQFLRQVEASRRLTNAYNVVRWNSDAGFDFWIDRTANFRLYEQNAAALMVASNNSQIVPILQNLSDAVRARFDVGAYLHWYARYGVDKVQFREAFETIQCTIDDYRDAFK